MTTPALPAQVFLYPPDGPVLRTPQDALDLIGSTYGTPAEVVAIGADRLDPSFFQLRTGLAGEVIQKFVNYRLRLAVVGDLSAQLAASEALRAFVQESNRGRAVWFLASLDELARRLEQR